MFAKLFERPMYGQVLAKLDANKKGDPELRWYVQPPSLGVCSFSLKFQEADDAWDDAEAAFNAADAEAADAAAAVLFSASGATPVA